ncbi:MAG: leucine-rich repeat protein [Dethiobacteria bacterium]
MVTILMVLGLLLGFSSFLMPGTASAVGNPVTIKVNGEAKKTFTWEELQAMESEEGEENDAWVGPRLYSTINTWPTKKWYAVEGVKLTALFDKAKVFEEAEVSFDDIQVVKVKATDGYLMTFTKKELFDDPRYYYPGLKAYHEYFGHIPGNPNNPEPEPVDAIIALKSVENSDVFNYMSPLNCPLLVLGQRWITEQTNHTFVKTVGEIDLLTEAPEKWASPTATPAPGTVPAGTKVVLRNEFNDSDKIYYTTDDTEPTRESPIYNWIASRWWGSREDVLDEINKPIEITEDTTIKAVTIGFGRENSDIATFEYKVQIVAVTGVSISESDQTLNEGETIQLNAVVEPENATNKGVSWSSSDEAVATVSETGLVTAVSEGEATITVTTDDGGLTDSITMTVEKPSVVPVTGVSISDGDQELEEGEIIQLNAVLEPENATNKGVSWSTSDAAVATVSETGLVTAVSEGEATVTVTTDDGGLTDSITVTVVPAADIFEVVDGVLTEYTGAGGDLIIPDDLNITSIGDSAFAELDTLTSAVIPEGVTSIGAKAFYKCSNLAAVTIPNGVKNIGNRAFTGCSSLTSIAIPEGITAIEDYTFNNCSNLRTVTIPKSVTHLNGYAFMGCSSLTSITIPENVTHLGANVFRGCSSLIEIILPDSVEETGIGVFMDCSSLTAVTISQKLTSISMSAFNGCSSLAEVTIPESVTEINLWSFENCSSLNKIIIPESVERIVSSAFNGCDQLTIYGYSGSYAETFAVEKEIPFVAIAKPPYKVIPVEDAAYTIGETADGIKTMTVNKNQIGLMYFTVSIESIVPHEGTETVIFTHLEDAVQLQLNALEADFDKVSAAKAGFNVNPGDVIKVYIVDKLTNEDNSNPIVLQ